MISNVLFSGVLRYRHRVRWYIMTSPTTAEDSQRFFEQHAYFGLLKEQVVFFLQVRRRQNLATCRLYMVLLVKMRRCSEMAPRGSGHHDAAA